MKLNGSYTSHKWLIVACSLLAMFTSCKPGQEKPVLFEVLDHKRTGLDFANKLTYNNEFNLFKYIYFYNGSGVGAGDFNNDGKIDLFFGSNQESNRLYLNTGDLHFKDVTAETMIPNDHGWTTGISVVDINNDGLLDIYVCRVGQYETLKSKNQLLVCQGIGANGIPTYVDKAKDYGLDFSGFSTQAAFLDYDMDGDLDMYLLNHSVHENGTFKPRADFAGTYNALSGDRLYRNDGATFADVTKECGINSTVVGYGLGITVADINLDGYPDIYIGNDFHENDYLYINQRNGTFKEDGVQQMMHTSQYSMGVDVADINNDAYPDVISADMLPADPYILKRSLGGDAYDIFQYKQGVGYSAQYSRNALQYNRRNGMFSEIGLYSGIAATDWSWAPLWLDFDNDGYKDLFVSNGIPKRLNDIDYINFVSNTEVQQKIISNNMDQKDISLIDKFPEIKLPDKFFKNNGDLSFTDEGEAIGGSRPTFSNGAVYADLDNDGDLDIVVNNIDAPALIYENRNDTTGGASSLRITLQGAPNNLNATGTKVIVYAGSGIRTYEKFPVRGFMSSMETPVLVGMRNAKIDSMHIVWPNNRYMTVAVAPGVSSINIKYAEDLPLFNYTFLTDHQRYAGDHVTDITRQTGIEYLHRENHFVEFDREPLIPHEVSSEGPALAVGDINHDGLEDMFIGAARNFKSAIFIQQANGRFSKMAQPALDIDSSYEDVDACWADVNNDTYPDLVVASGGNEYYGKEIRNSPRVYLNNGQGALTRKQDAFLNLYLTASCVVPYDFNGDGFVDLFVGARAVPYEYGQVPASYLLLNDRKGGFTDVTATYAKELLEAGFVTSASWFDVDKDGDKDLVLSCEWGTICAFVNDKGRFTRKDLTDKKGWWNTVYPCDIDNDGDIDLIAGNLGLNSRLKASATEPVRLYHNDFDDNGRKEQLLTYYLGGKEIAFANKAELEKQLPMLKKKFLYAEDFAKATLPELFGAAKLKNAEVSTADYMASAVLVNNGNWQFETRMLPAEAQFAPVRTAVAVNANGDNLPDILLGGNYYDNNIQMGRYDADYGTLLINKGNGNFVSETLNGLTLRGQVRTIKPILLKSGTALVLAGNNDSTRLLQFPKATR